MTEGSFQKSDGDTLYGSEVNKMINMCPVGAVIAWLKTYANTPALPDNWVECNGQVLSDADSVYDGQTIPDLYGANENFLYGKSTSGVAKTEDFLPVHSHNLYAEDGYSSSKRIETYGAGGSWQGSWIANSAAAGTALKGYSVVWIMKIKL